MKDLNTIAFETGIMPILFADEKNCAERVIKAIEQTEVPVVEILQRGELALDALKEAVKVKKTAYVGAGTVCTLEHCKRMVDLGADFIVSPGFNLEMVKWCVDQRVPIIPGVTNPSEIMLAADAGLRLVKYFPFFELGGDTFLNAISGPFPEMKFVVTGGLNDKHLHYLSNHKIAAIGGVWMFQTDFIHDVIDEKNIIYRMNKSLEIGRHYRNDWQLI